MFSIQNQKGSSQININDLKINLKKITDLIKNTKIHKTKSSI